MRRKNDDYFEEDQQTENYEKPRKDPVLRKLNWLIIIFIPQALFFLWLLLSLLINLLGAPFGIG